MDNMQDYHTYYDNGERSQSHSESTDGNNQFGLYSPEEGSSFSNRSVFDGFTIKPLHNADIEKIPGDMAEMPMEKIPGDMAEMPMEKIPGDMAEMPMEKIPGDCQQEMPIEEAPKDMVEAPIEEAPKDMVEAPIEEAPIDMVEAPIEEAPKDMVEAPIEETPIDMVEANFYNSSNAGMPMESSNIPVNVDDGNDIEKLDFGSQNTNFNGSGDDLLSGNDGVNTFDVNLLLNAKPEIYQQHVDGEGKIDWHGVTGENNNFHDHWLDSIGQDSITDFSGSGGDGDKVNIAGHTVAVTVLEELDNQIKLGVYSDQGADGSRGGDAHDFDVLGTLTINHDGNFDYGNDVTVNSQVADGAFEFA